jgi:hypothetical protein
LKLSREGVPVLACLATALTPMLLACGSSTETGDSLACPQTHEFGNFGCARAAGRVLGSHGEPLEGVLVVARQPTDPERGAYDEAPSTTDNAGAFLLQVTRYAEPTPTSTPDTLTVYVVASLLRGDTAVRDSAQVRLEYATVGQVPKTVPLDLQLPSP